MADAFESGMAEAQAQELLGVGPDGKKKKGKGQSGVDLLAAQMENMKRMLEEKEVAMRQMAEEKMEAEAQLKATEQEVNALMCGITGGPLTPGARGGGGGFGDKDSPGGGGKNSPGGKKGGKGGKGGGKGGGDQQGFEPLDPEEAAALAAALPAAQRKLFESMSETEQASTSDCLLMGIRCPSDCLLMGI